MRIEEQLTMKNIPMVGENVDVDAWAESLGYVIKDGQLMDGDRRAVAVSPGYGAGWSTWNKFSPLDTVANLILLTMVNKGDADEFRELYDCMNGEGSAEEMRFSMSGLEDTIIEWVPVDKQFRITEYDGYETIEYRDTQAWL